MENDIKQKSWELYLACVKSDYDNFDHDFYCCIDKVKEFYQCIEYIKIEEEVNKPIEDLELTVRAMNCLRLDVKIHTIKDLLEYTKHDLLKINGLGKHSCREIEDVLRDRGLFLRKDNLLDNK